MKRIGHVVSKIAQPNVVFDECFQSCFESHHLEGLGQEQQRNCISRRYRKRFRRVHIVKQIWKVIDTSRAKFDAGTSVAIVDSIMEKIRKISTSSLAYGKDIAVNMIRPFCDDVR